MKNATMKNATMKNTIIKNAEKELIALAHKCVNYGKYEYVMIIVNRLTEKRGNDPFILSEIARVFVHMRNFVKALEYAKKAFDLQKSVEQLKMLAFLNFMCRNYEDSAIQYETLLEYEPTYEMYNHCITSYEKIDIYPESIRIAKEAIQKFDDAKMLSHLFFIYLDCGMAKEAIECCDELKKKFPNDSTTFNALGFLYESIYNDYPGAKKYYLKSGKMGFKEAYYNLGVCCKQSEDFVAAEKYIKKFISFKKETEIDYNYTMGSIYMAQRKLRSGYKYYKNRRNIMELNTKNAKCLWDGKDYPDKVLFVSEEQGFGDNVQFLRYIPLVAKKFKEVIYEVPVNLLELFRNSFPQKKYPNIKFVTVGQIVRYNKFAYIMDLPYLLHMNYQNIPSRKGYLVYDKALYEKYKKDYFEVEGLKIGLNWRAKGMALRDAMYRTIDAPYYFKPIMDIPDIKYYSFQMGDIFGMCEKYPQITDISDTFKTFNDTAAALKNLDILITVDTALAHVAGALGIKTYLLLCHAPDWRWFDNTEKTEWYSSVTIIKQQDRRTWEDVSEKLHQYILKDAKAYRKNKKTKPTKTKKSTKTAKTVKTAKSKKTTRKTKEDKKV